MKSSTVREKRGVNESGLVSLEPEHILKPGMREFDRGQRLRSRVISVNPHICIERARFVTQVYRETEHEHILIRRTKAFDRILRNISVYILDDELIVGHQASRQRSAPLFPEFAVSWLVDEIDTLETRPQDKFMVPADVKREFLEEIFPYWKGRTISDRLYSYLTEDIRLQRFAATVFSLGCHEEQGLGHVALDYTKVLHLGIEGIKSEINEHMAGLKLWKREDYEKKLFYESCLMICDSVVGFARRYGEKAKLMASVERDATRRDELLTIAQNCNRVPENPAGNFYEALQSFWFVQLVPQIYDNGVSISPGRFDQYMYPYYTSDISNKRLTKVGAQQLLEALWVKFTEPIKVYASSDAEFWAGYPMGQNLCIGGIGPDGEDATNDLSYRLLEAHSHMLLMQPNFSARIHQRTPHTFLLEVCRAIRLGNGMPQITNDDVFISALTSIGVSLKDARDYVPIGCVEAAPTNAWGRCNGGYLNLTKIVELALNNGICRLTGKQVGPRTGDPRKFKTFEQVVKAYREQMKYSVERLVTWDNLLDMNNAHLMPTPFTSMVVADCIESGIDVTAGGARYNWTAPSGIGIANAGDSLFAVKKMVFDEKAVTMQTLIDALDSNFEGYVDLRQILLNKVPKYGNDIHEVDLMVKFATDVFLDTIEGYETYRGGPFVASLIPVTSYVAFGKGTGATPDGRCAEEPLADGISPTSGMDRSGPTAVFKSVCTIDHHRCPSGVIFNQKINPEILSTQEGLKKFAELIRTYIRLGGCHVQFNIVSADTLRDAQEKPEEHQGLVVRVAGYSAFFNEIHRDVQDSIIARTEQTI